jgi:hypothetical protein
LLSDIAKKIIGKRPGLATEEAIIETHTGDTTNDENVKVKRITPMQLEVQWNRVEVLKVLLKHGRSLDCPQQLSNADPHPPFAYPRRRALQQAAEASANRSSGAHI